MSRVVLDASAVLALLNAEPGSTKVEETIPGALMSAVNLSEVVAKLGETGMPEEAVRRVLGDIELDIHPFDMESAYETGALRGRTRELGLSLGDRACIALGIRLRLPVLTTDRDWRKLDAEIEIRLIR